jgi:DNA-binding CsgD family transcriptional regulator
LTLQEDRVFLLAAKNLSNPEIASALNIKVKTVENYMSLIYQKLSLRNRYDLLEFGRKAGIHR